MRPSLVAALAALTALASGCARVTPTASPAPRPERPPAESLTAPVAFGGTVTLGKQRLPLVLELRSRKPPNYDATLRIPAVSMEADGKGTWSGDRLRLTLRYGDGCPGTVEVDARVTDRGGEGTLSAHDCTGGESGALVLVRRVADDGTGASVR
jgi:hypothetical protein